MFKPGDLVKIKIDSYRYTITYMTFMGAKYALCDVTDCIGEVVEVTKYSTYVWFPQLNTYRRFWFWGDHLKLAND